MNQQVMQERKVQQLMQLLRAAIVVVVVAAIVGGVWLTMQSRAKARSEEAFGLLFQAEKLERVATEEAQTLKTDLFKVMASWSPDKKKDYEDKLNRVSKEYPKTAAASVASLRLGRFRFAEGKVSVAREDFQKAIENANTAELTVYRAMALDGLASTFEAENKLDEARKSYEEALQVKDNPLKPLAYLGAARVLRGQGKKAEAKTAYEKCMQEFPGSVYAKKARALMNMPERAL